MKHLGLAAVLLLASIWVSAAESPPPETGTQQTRAAFQLNIQAPDDIKDLLTRHLDLQRYRELTDLSDDELARLLRQAQDDARQLLGTLGYFSPRITVTRQVVQSGTPVVDIAVTPGETTRIRQVLIQFTGAINTDTLAAAQREQIQNTWSLPAGYRFTQNAWDAAKQQALRQLTTQRFPAGHISESLAEIDTDTGQATLRLTLDSGPAYRTGELEIEGLQRYDLALVQRLTRLTPGNDYSQAELAAAQQRLSDSGYFDSALVTLDTRANPEGSPDSGETARSPSAKTGTRHRCQHRQRATPVRRAHTSQGAGHRLARGQQVAAGP